MQYKALYLGNWSSGPESLEQPPEEERYAGICVVAVVWHEADILRAAIKAGYESLVLRRDNNLTSKNDDSEGQDWGEICAAPEPEPEPPALVPTPPPPAVEAEPVPEEISWTAENDNNDVGADDCTNVSYPRSKKKKGKRISRIGLI